MELREYQNELIVNLRNEMADGTNELIAQLGCGGGKSVIQAEIAKRATDLGNTVLFIVHRQELCNQIYDTFSAHGVDMDRCDVCMVQTMARRLNRYSKYYYNLLICDECHHAGSKTYNKVFEHFDCPKIGFTATPVRYGGNGLGSVFKKIIPSVSTDWLIKNNFLAPYKYYSVPLADTTHLSIKYGEFVQSEIDEIMNQDNIYGDVVKMWKELGRNEKTIIYCPSIELSISVSERFISEGYNCKHIDGGTPKGEREGYMQAFRSGEIQILCNVDLFGEGISVDDCGCVVLCRPTNSLTLFIQQSMRSMRYLPNKTAIILDMVGNVYRHGLPDDEREWMLETKRRQENIVKIKECPECYAVYLPQFTHCPYCGFENHVVKEKKGKKVVDVDLVEVQRKEILKDTKLRDFKGETFDEVREYQKLRGYKFGWCLRHCYMNNIEIPAKYRYQLHKFCQ